MPHGPCDPNTNNSLQPAVSSLLEPCLVISKALGSVGALITSPLSLNFPIASQGHNHQPQGESMVKSEISVLAMCITLQMFVHSNLASFLPVYYLLGPESHCCPDMAQLQFCRENLKRWMPSPPATSSICMALRTQWLCEYHWWLAGKPTHFNPLWSTWTGMRQNVHFQVILHKG